MCPLLNQYVSLQIASDTLFELSRLGDLCVWNSEDAAKTVDDYFFFARNNMVAP
jgi:hypothetical protein